VNERLWTRVEDALDRRVDPFDEPELAEALRADPRAARATRRFLARLEVLAEIAPPAAPRAQRRLGGVARLAAAAALLVALVPLVPLVPGAARLLRTPPSTEDAATRPERPTSTVKLVVEHVTPPPARGARVVLEPRRVLGWTLEGETP